MTEAQKQSTGRAIALLRAQLAPESERDELVAAVFSTWSELQPREVMQIWLSLSSMALAGLQMTAELEGCTLDEVIAIFAADVGAE